ncbi:hypothetical protein HELRODRAFT_166007 [Helobdella robusta]|uniref:Uncharacterized protein n=1 Tax=Helobdella robusta TaxID=6412 RepID=T1EXK9_HELRO|nr:hypothetical protein HELRODRAFT_166007 [Helobdella robusta]ESN90349.1 hypothetical protein HELRODRAFT_166007 [Helobdella robusta]
MKKKSFFDESVGQRCFQRANIPTIKEPTGLMEEGSLRPDGYTISPWAQGRSLAWDVTFPHTMAEKYINLTSQEAGAAALRAADFKNSKYAALAESKIFQPVCIETFGPIDAQTQSFLNELCSRIVEVSDFTTCLKLTIDIDLYALIASSFHNLAPLTIQRRSFVTVLLFGIFNKPCCLVAELVN